MQCTTLQLNNSIVMPVSTADLQAQRSAAEKAQWSSRVLLARAHSSQNAKDRLSAKQASAHQAIVAETSAIIPVLTQEIDALSQESVAQTAAAAFSNRPLSKYVVRLIVSGGHLKYVTDIGIRNAVMLRFFDEAAREGHEIRDWSEWVLAYPSGDRFVVEVCK